MSKPFNANKYLVDYLIHSYLYYVKGTSLITDHQFDQIAHNLRDNFDKVTIEHKKLVNLDNLKVTTSAFYIKDYPLIVQSCAEALLKGQLKL